MKRLTFLFIIIFIVGNAIAQDYSCFDKNYLNGKRQFNVQQFDSAYNSFKAAKYGCKLMRPKSDIDEWLIKAQEGVIFLLKNKNYISNLLNAAINKLEKDPTYAFRLAEEVLRIDSNNKEAKNIIIKSYYKAPFYNMISEIEGRPHSDLNFSNTGKYIYANNSNDCPTNEYIVYDIEAEKEINIKKKQSLNDDIGTKRIVFSKDDEFILKFNCDSTLFLLSVNNDKVFSFSNVLAADFDYSNTGFFVLKNDKHIYHYDFQGNLKDKITLNDSKFVDIENIRALQNDESILIVSNTEFIVFLFSNKSIKSIKRNYDDEIYDIKNNCILINSDQSTIVWDFIKNTTKTLKGEAKLSNGINLLTQSYDSTYIWNSQYNYFGAMENNGHPIKFYENTFYTSSEDSLIFNDFFGFKLPYQSFKYETPVNDFSVDYDINNAMTSVAAFPYAVYLYNRKGEIVSHLLGHTNVIQQTLFSKDGSKLVTSSGMAAMNSIENTIRIWNLTPSEFENTFSSTVKKNRFNPFPENFYLKNKHNYFSMDKSCFIRNEESGANLIYDTRIVKLNMKYAEFMPDKDLIIGFTHNDSVFIKDFSNITIKSGFFPGSGFRQSISYSNVKNEIAITNRYGIYLCDTTLAKKKEVNVFSEGGVMCLDYSSTGDTLITGNYDGTISLIYKDNIKKISKGFGQIHKIHLSSCGKYILVLSFFEEEAILLDSNGNRIITIKNGKPIYDAFFSCDNKYIVLNHGDSETLWTFDAFEILKLINDQNRFGKVYRINVETLNTYR